MKVAVNRDQNMRVTIAHLVWDQFEKSYSTVQDSFMLYAYCERGIWEVYCEDIWLGSKNFRVLKFEEKVTELNEEVMSMIIDRAWEKRYYPEFQSCEAVSAKVELLYGTMELKLEGWELVH